MDATCKVQDNILVFRLVHNMCPEFWVHIIEFEPLFYFIERLLSERFIYVDVEKLND